MLYVYCVVDSWHKCVLVSLSGHGKNAWPCVTKRRVFLWVLAGVVCLYLLYLSVLGWGANVYIRILLLFSEKGIYISSGFKHLPSELSLYLWYFCGSFFPECTLQMSAAVELLASCPRFGFSPTSCSSLSLAKPCGPSPLVSCLFLYQLCHW